jgi:hypothetical protein
MGRSEARICEKHALKNGVEDGCINGRIGRMANPGSRGECVQQETES